MEIEELKKTISEADNQLKACDEAFKGTFNRFMVEDKLFKIIKLSNDLTKFISLLSE